MLREEAQTAAVTETKAEAKEEAVVQTAKKPEKETADKAVSDLEEAARLAKEKQRQEGLNIKEKQEYVSKFEKILDNKTSKEEHSAVKKSFKRKDEDEPKRKTTFDLSKKDYELKPIYTEEELEEIARQEAEEQENDWINDDIDFDEYDQYYEE